MSITRPRHRRALRCQRHHRKSSELCPHPLCSSTWDSSSYHVHHAVDSDPSISASSGKCEKYQHRCTTGKLYLLRHGPTADLEWVCQPLFNQVFMLIISTEFAMSFKIGGKRLIWKKSPLRRRPFLWKLSRSHTHIAGRLHLSQNLATGGTTSVRHQSFSC
jgi:hypothetical protein